tara:strand:- start:621 stop:1679 length:1059 start_codon:yes stop_codon:yes gene_type:complete
MFNVVHDPREEAAYLDFHVRALQDGSWLEWGIFRENIFVADECPPVTDSQVDQLQDLLASKEAEFRAFFAHFHAPRPPDHVRIHLTRYGPGGSINATPGPGMAHVILRADRIENDAWMIENAVHETVHLMVDPPLRKKGYSQDVIEGVVNFIQTCDQLADGLCRHHSWPKHVPLPGPAVLEIIRLIDWTGAPLTWSSLDPSGPLAIAEIWHLGFPEAFLTPIADLGLSNRIANAITCINREAIVPWGEPFLMMAGQLAIMSDAELLCTPGLGRRSLGPVKEALTNCGIERHGICLEYGDDRKCWENFLALYEKSHRPCAKAFAETRRYDPADVRAFYEEQVDARQKKKGGSQ